jgi:hypothetical protein
MGRWFAACPGDLQVQLLKRATDVVLYQLEVEADQMWSVAKRKTNEQWSWIALDALTPRS